MGEVEEAFREIEKKLIEAKFNMNYLRELNVNIYVDEEKKYVKPLYEILLEVERAMKTKKREVENAK